MGNDVKIVVTADDDTSFGFAKAKATAKAFEVDVIKGAKAAGKTFGEEMGNVASNLDLSSPLSKTLLRAGVAAAPALSGIIAGAVTGAAGTAGVIGGVLIAARDPRVKTAGQQLSKNLLSGLEEQGSSFIEPALQAVELLEQKFKESGDTLENIFDNSSKFLVPLTDALGDMVQSTLEGIETATGRAEPVMEAFGDGFRSLGEGIEEFFGDMSEDADSAAASITALFDDTEYAIKAVGETVKVLNSTFGWLDENVLSLSLFTQAEQWREQLEGVNAEIGDTVGTWVDGSESMAEGTDAVTDSLQTLANELKAQTDPVFALLDAETQLGEARTKYNKAIVKYGENSAEARDELNNMAEAAINLQGITGELGASFDGELSPSLIHTLEAAGWTKTEIKALGREFATSKKRADDFAGNYAANVRVNGVPRALNQLYTIQEEIDEIPRAVYIAMHITGVTNVSKAKAAVKKNQASGGISGAASGGGRDGLTWVGEQGPELLDLPAGSRVHSNPDSQRMASGNGGGGVTQILVSAKPGASRSLIEVLVESLAYECRTRYEGSAQNMIGQGA